MLAGLLAGGLAGPRSGFALPDIKVRSGNFLTSAHPTPTQLWRSSASIFIARVSGQEFIPAESCEQSSRVAYTLATVAVWKGAAEELTSLRVPVEYYSPIMQVGTYCLIVKAEPESRLPDLGPLSANGFAYIDSPAPVEFWPSALVWAGRDARELESIADSMGAHRAGPTLVRELAPFLDDTSEVNRTGAAELLSEVALDPDEVDGHLVESLARAKSPGIEGCSRMRWFDFPSIPVAPLGGFDRL